MQRLFLLLVCFFICNEGFTQPVSSGGQYPFVHYTPKDGLVNSRVRKAYQDSKGRMYFITYSGLSVFDGARFKNYTTQNGLLIGLVNDVLEVGDDSLLVAVNTSGLNVLVRGQMKTVNTSGTHCPVVNNFLKSHDGTIYAAADDGLYEWKQKQFEQLNTLIPGLTDTAIYLEAIAEYKDFLVFSSNDLKNRKGLFLYNKKSNSITDAWPDEPILSLQSDHSGYIWVSIYSSKIGNLDTAALNAGKLTQRKPYTSYAKTEGLLSGAIVFNQQNEPIIYTLQNEIIRFRKDGSSVQIAPPENSVFFGQSFFSDREDVLWICNDGNGVYKLANTRLQSAVSYFNESNEGVKTLYSNTPDSCWMMATKGSLSLHTSFGRKIFRSTPSFIATALYYSGNYLYATYYNKLFLATIPQDNNTTIRFRLILSLPDSSNFGGHFVTDPVGNFIFTDADNIGVLRKDTFLFKFPLQPYELIVGMHIDKNNRLFAASLGKGFRVFSIHPENPTRYLVEEDPVTKDLGAASPRCMTVDKDGLFWIGTRYDGLMAFEYKNNRLQKSYHFQSGNGLTDDFITALTCDKNNNIVVGTQTGLDRLIKIDHGGYRIENITRSNNVFSFISKVWTDAADNVFALTNSGRVFQVEPVQNSPVGYEPQLFIEEMKVNGQLVPHAAPPLRLEYFHRNISFSVAAPTFIDERQVKFSYLLTGGGNNEWSDTVSNTDINLLNLSPGNYTLHVKSFFHSTTYSPKEIAFSFVILFPWWQTWWFRLSTGVLITGLLITGIRFYYRRKLEIQKAELERKQAIEKERTRIATDMHDDLGAGLSRIKFLSETIGIKKQKEQPIEEDISKIREYSHEMIDKMGEIVWALNEKNDSLSDLLSYTRSYAVEYLSQNGINSHVTIQDQLPDIFVSGEFRRNIYLTVKEALHNVVKHAQAQNVQLDINIENELIICIKDDGIGFDPENIRQFSNGISNMQTRLKEINGLLAIENGEGTEIWIKAPLG